MSLDLSQVEGLTMLTGPRSAALSPHRFSLPPGFDTARYSSNWVEDGPGVQEAQQKEVIEHANISAAGWTVYMALPEKKFSVLADDKDGEKSSLPKRVPYTRVVGKKVFVLMMRPKALQLALNAIHADTSRMLVNQEIRGETSQANAGGDPGILTNNDLRRASRAFEEDASPDYLAPSAGGKPSRVGESAELNIN